MMSYCLYFPTRRPGISYMLQRKWKIVLLSFIMAIVFAFMLISPQCAPVSLRELRMNLTNIKNLYQSSQTDKTTTGKAIIIPGENVTLNSSMPTGEETTHYWLRTEVCTIKKFEPNHPSIAKITSQSYPKLVCMKKLPLTESSGRNLIFHRERMTEYTSPKGNLTCVYQGILRIQQDPLNYTFQCDRKYKLLNKIPLLNGTTAIKDDGILVTCEDDARNAKKNPVYRNVHHFAQPYRAQTKRQKFKTEVGERGDRPEKLSVIIMGTDSVSRSHLRRSMPKTFDYLTNELEAMELYGHNKVAVNTYPCVTSLLMGLTASELNKHKCQTSKKKSKYDDCPFVWKDFAEKGYVTAYAEDHGGHWIFQSFTQAGFVEEPTDYYDMATAIASENLIAHNGGIKGLRTVCQGPLLSTAVVHNFSLAVAEELRDVPSFAFYWKTMLTHDHLHAARHGDETSFEYLKKLYEGGILEHTILLYISDHGMTAGNIRATYAGSLEDRLPYTFIRFPKWFREKYPEATKNVRINQRRLTTTFDIHTTLLDILHRGYVNTSASPTKTKHGQSLFREIPFNRTCKEAEIPEHFCACEDSKKADPEDPMLTQAADKTITAINEDLRLFPQCAQLSLLKVIGGRLGLPRRSVETRFKNTLSTSYDVVFATKPGEGQFEATLSYYNNQFESPSDVSRINLYGNQSHCINHLTLRNYCYCLDLLSG